MIAENWSNLIQFAEKQDFNVQIMKGTFGEMTKGYVKTFKEEIKRDYDEYILTGPGSADISLEEGVEKLADSIMKITSANINKDEHVLSEQLFDLPISKFDELIKMESFNQTYS